MRIALPGGSHGINDEGRDGHIRTIEKRVHIFRAWLTRRKECQKSRLMATGPQSQPNQRLATSRAKPNPQIEGRRIRRRFGTKHASILRDIRGAVMRHRETTR
jgi:hypothetical protein